MMRKGKQQRGMMLVPVTFMVLLLGGLALALLIEVDGDRTAVNHQETSAYALEIAEAGLARAELEIMALIDSGVDGVGNMTGTLQNGDYDVQATGNVLSPERWRLVSRGECGLSVRRIEVGVRRRGDSDFVDAMFSKLQFDVNGSLQSDSFDSRLGSYASQVVNVDAAGKPYAGDNGDLGSNADIVMNGTDVAVRGNSIAGVLAETLENGSPLITGDTQPRTEVVNLPDPTYAEFVDAMNNNNNAYIAGLPGNSVRFNDRSMSLTIASSTILTLPAGTYFFSDISMTANAQIVISGDVKIYATGDVKLGGQGILNQVGPASSLQIVMHPYALPSGNNAPKNGTSLALSGGSEFVGTVYAPAVDADLGGNMHMYGGIVANSIDVNGDVSFHYDEALGDQGGRGVVLLERLYWRELNTPAR